MHKPSRGLKMQGYFVQTPEGGKRYKVWHYYIWTDRGWRLIPHKTWCVIAKLLIDIYGLQDVWITEEHELCD